MQLQAWSRLRSVPPLHSAHSVERRWCGASSGGSTPAYLRSGCMGISALRGAVGCMSGCAGGGQQWGSRRAPGSCSCKPPHARLPPSLPNIGPHFLRYWGVSMNCSTRANRAAAEETWPGCRSAAGSASSNTTTCRHDQQVPFRCVLLTPDVLRLDAQRVYCGAAAACGHQPQPPRRPHLVNVEDGRCACNLARQQRGQLQVLQQITRGLCVTIPGRAHCQGCAKMRHFGCPWHRCRAWAMHALPIITHLRILDAGGSHRNGKRVGTAAGRGPGGSESEEQSVGREQVAAGGGGRRRRQRSGTRQFDCMHA